MSSHMIVTAKGGIGVVSVDVLLDSLEKYFPDAQFSLIDGSRWKLRTDLYDIEVEPVSDTSFTITMSGSGNVLRVDGTNDQNNMAAVAICEALDTPNRVVAIESGGAWFTYLVPGMAPEDVETNRRPFDELEVW